MRGREDGGAAPGAKLSGTTQAIPAPPPTQPRFFGSASMPSDITPPTDVFLMTMSPTSVPIVATTTLTPSATLGAFVTTVIGEAAPTSRTSFFSFSLPATGSQDVISPILYPEEDASPSPAPPAAGRGASHASHGSAEEGFSFSHSAHTHGADMVNYNSDWGLASDRAFKPTKNDHLHEKIKGNRSTRVCSHSLVPHRLLCGPRLSQPRVAATSASLRKPKANKQLLQTLHTQGLGPRNWGNPNSGSGDRLLRQCPRAAHDSAHLRRDLDLGARRWAAEVLRRAGRHLQL